MKDFSTARLTIHQVDETEDPEEYLRLFNSAPDLLRAIHPEMDEDVWTLEDPAPHHMIKPDASPQM